MTMKMTGYGTWKGECQQCGTEFISHKKTGKFCSDVCRVRWARRKKQIYRHRNDALYAIRALMALTKDIPEFGDEINQVFREIETQVRDGLRLRPDTEEKALLNMLYDRARKRNMV
jgi:hypothetical protein